MVLLGDLKIMLIIKGMSNQVIRCSVTLILQSTCVRLPPFLANSDRCDVSKAHVFIYLPLWPNYSLADLSSFCFQHFNHVQYINRRGGCQDQCSLIIILPLKSWSLSFSFIPTTQDCWVLTVARIFQSLPFLSYRSTACLLVDFES